MWQPEPGWARLPGVGPSTAGVWLATEEARPVVVKRLLAPTTHDPLEASVPDHVAYWRRAADVAISGAAESTLGLVAPPLVRYEEDADGITLVHPWVVEHELDDHDLANAVGRFACNSIPRVSWLVADQLASRLEQVASRGGWSTLARTPMADVADVLWRRRDVLLNRLRSHTQVLQHGDPVPSNLRGRESDSIVAIDWACIGVGPAGADLGYLALSVGEGFEALLEAYLEGLGTGVDPREVRLAAQTSAVYTVLTRADWALARVAPGEGALSGKYRHPSVAPYIRAMQRQLPQIEALTTLV